MSKKILIYHHNDQDGYLSAAIAHHFLSKESENEIRFAIGDYSANVDFEGLRWADEVFILDYSLQPKIMEKFAEKITWIDHHKTAIKEIGIIELALDYKFPGKREIGKSGCLLTWEYFSNDWVPWVVHLVNDRDVWQWKYGDSTAAFHEASRMFLTNIEEWQRCFKDGMMSDVYTTRLEEDGEMLLDYIRKVVDDYNDALAWEGVFEGHKAVFLNGHVIISGELHKRLRQDHPEAEFAVVFSFKKEVVRVGLYRQDGLSAPDLGAMAQKYGGGGHEAAAGFHIEYDKWIVILEKSYAKNN